MDISGPFFFLRSNFLNEKISTDYAKETSDTTTRRILWLCANKLSGGDGVKDGKSDLIDSTNFITKIRKNKEK